MRIIYIITQYDGQNAECSHLMHHLFRSESDQGLCSDRSFSHTHAHTHTLSLSVCLSVSMCNAKPKKCEGKALFKDNTSFQGSWTAPAKTKWATLQAHIAKASAHAHIGCGERYLPVLTSLQPRVSLDKKQHLYFLFLDMTQKLQLLQAMQGAWKGLITISAAPGFQSRVHGQFDPLLCQHKFLHHRALHHIASLLWLGPTRNPEILLRLPWGSSLPLNLLCIRKAPPKTRKTTAK